MRLVLLITVLVLAGCSSRPTLEELEDEALVTGDWTAVESREQMLERRRDRTGNACPGEQIKACYGAGVSTECYCLQPSGFH